MSIPFTHSDISFPVPMTKMSGTGNDFIIIDHREPFISPEDQPTFAKLVCRHKVSAGADGLILIENCDDADFQWQFYNADGSAAEMCGNGARCAARYAFTNKIAPAKMRFKTTAGIIEAEMVSDAVSIKLTAPENLILNQKVTLDGNNQTIHSINTGVPHVVCFVDEIENTPVNEWGRTIRFHKLFEPAGTNVNFVKLTDTSSLHVRTYERGVEGETLACGTGAVASAIIAGLTKSATSPVEATTSGGDKLIIHYGLKGNTRSIEQVFLEGPANIIYEAKLSKEAFGIC